MIYLLLQGDVVMARTISLLVTRQNAAAKATHSLSTGLILDATRASIMPEAIADHGIEVASQSRRNCRAIISFLRLHAADYDAQHRFSRAESRRIAYTRRTHALYGRQRFSSEM